MRVQIALAAARDICWPIMDRAKVSKLAGSDRSGGGPKRDSAAAISASIVASLSSAPPEEKSFCCMIVISKNYQASPTHARFQGSSLIKNGKICRAKKDCVDDYVL
jgi:hypothetical protein